MDLDDLRLKVLYGEIFDKCKRNIFVKCPDLRDAAEYIFTSKVSLYKMKIENENLEGQAWCEGDTIYISEKVLMQNEYRLTEVLLHELLHIKYPDYSEEQVIEETNNRMRAMFRTSTLLKSI